MKIIYTLLFFADTLLLIILTVFFLKLKDARAAGGEMMAVLSGILVSIVALAILLNKYLKTPSAGRDS